MKNILQDYASPDNQEARAFLRERFLRAMTAITDKECKINVVDKTSVTAKFGGADIDFLKIYVKDLESAPGFSFPNALVNTSDILSIEVPNASYQKLIETEKNEQNGKPVDS